MFLSACMPAGQMRAPALVANGCESSYGCWKLNSGPLEEQSVLLTAELSLQPPNSSFKYKAKLLFFNIIKIIKHQKMSPLLIIKCNDS